MFGLLLRLPGRPGTGPESREADRKNIPGPEFEAEHAHRTLAATSNPRHEMCSKMIPGLVESRRIGCFTAGWTLLRVAFLHEVVRLGGWSGFSLIWHLVGRWQSQTRQRCVVCGSGPCSGQITCRRAGNAASPGRLRRDRGQAAAGNGVPSTDTAGPGLRRLGWSRRPLRPSRPEANQVALPGIENLRIGAPSEVSIPGRNTAIPPRPWCAGRGL